ncbi:GlxA family transcriptional regulator [Micromonospora sp. NBC_00421]|uniref:GlxA family transcriptional regulator n=1 Tax=Micromonospora sp. NBC_00421 TaxID=2975976 RepID=UPI002E1F465E
MHHVVALVRPVQPAFALGCAVEVFDTVPPGTPRHYTFEVATETPGPIPTTAGYAMSVPRDLSAVRSADTVIIPGWTPVETPPSPQVSRALRQAHQRGARLVALCGGTFALARTGLLDGRSATTHWARADRLRQEFPAIRVESDTPFVDHGDVATSAGAGAGVDLCLHLLARDHGAAHAALVARYLAMTPHRASHGTHPPPEDPLDGLARWVDARLGSPLSVTDLAAQLQVSPRTLARRFTDRFATSPGAWLLARRVAAARTLLAETDLPVDAVAARVGLTSATNLRRRFRAQVGTTPGAYRRALRDG